MLSDLYTHTPWHTHTHIYTQHSTHTLIELYSSDTFYHWCCIFFDLSPLPIPSFLLYMKTGTSSSWSPTRMAQGSHCSLEGSLSPQKRSSSSDRWHMQTTVAAVLGNLGNGFSIVILRIAIHSNPPTALIDRFAPAYLQHGSLSCRFE